MTIWTRKLTSVNVLNTPLTRPLNQHDVMTQWNKGTTRNSEFVLTGRISKVCRAPVFSVIVSLSLAAAEESDAGGQNTQPAVRRQSRFHREEKPPKHTQLERLTNTEHLQCIIKSEHNTAAHTHTHTRYSESHPGVWSAAGSGRESAAPPRSWGRGCCRSPPIGWVGSVARRRRGFLVRMKSARTPSAPGDPSGGLTTHTHTHGHFNA